MRIERSAIDRGSLQAIPLGFSDKLLAVLYVQDFRIDGLLFLRRDTITDIFVNATARFQQRLINEAGDLTDNLFSLPHSIVSLQSVLAGLPTRQIVILEQERLDASGFWMGRYVWREENRHGMHELTGAGNWLDEITQLDIDAITCCQLDTNYIRYYQRYFDTHGFPDLPV